jgi:membrane associated rhomboid family serine protease
MFPLHDDIPSRRTPWVMYVLIAANALVFLFTLSLSQRQLVRFYSAFGVVPAEFAGPGGGFQPEPVGFLTLFTSMFLHGGLLHIVVNLWYLWIFGNNIEDRMGHARFLVFYLLGGVSAGIAHIALNWGSQVPSIGASGAIAAVLGAYLVLFPRARILTLVPVFFIWVVRLPALLVLGMWFVLQLISGVGSFGAEAGVAYWAHIGGFVFGLLAVHFFAQRRSAPRYRDWRQEQWWPT